MNIRIGRVTKVLPSGGKVKVLYEDEKNTSLPLPMLTMNNEYSMPAVGDRVTTIHMGNGSSKGFVLGTFYGGDTKPKAKSGYRKDFGDDAYITCDDGKYILKASKVTIEADEITLKCAYGNITVSEIMKRLERIEDKLNLPHTV